LVSGAARLVPAFSAGASRETVTAFLATFLASLTDRRLSGPRRNP